MIRFTSQPAVIAAVLLVATGLSAASGGASAATSAQATLIPVSSYGNVNNRPDPFLPVRLKSRGGEPKVAINSGELQLQGIMWHPTKPAAVINRQRIELNETVTLRLNTGDHPVKVVAIDRNHVVLKMGEQQIELKLER